MIFPVARLASGVAAVAASVASPRELAQIPSIASTVGPATGLVPTALSTTGIAAATSALSPTTLNLLQNVRGGAASTLVDMSRETLFVQGLGTYGTISALIMNASLRLWTSTSFKKEQNRIVPNVFNIATVLCMVSGTFTAILFQLLTIYSKAALGMGNDVGYVAFKSATQTFRVWGFRCFLTEMISFIAVFFSRLYNGLWDDARKQNKETVLTPTGKCIMGGSFALMVTGFALIRSVLHLASKNIY